MVHSDADRSLLSQTATWKPLTAEEVCTEYAPQVYKLVAHMIGNSADTADIVQDVLLCVVRKLSTFRGQASFGTWLHRVTVNAVNTYRRKQLRHHQQRVSMFRVEAEESHYPGALALGQHHRPDDDLITQETRQLIDAAIAELPEKERDTFVLAEVQGLSNAAIGVTLGLSLPAVKSRLHRARMHLKQTLAPHFENLAG